MKQKNKNLYIILAGIIIPAVAVVLYFTVGSNPKSISEISKSESKSKSAEKPIVIEENLVAPETKKITGVEARIIEKGAVEVPLAPKSEGEKVIVSKAVLTVKSAYDLASVEAQKWSSVAAPVFIKSLGAITLEGKSSQWQLVFSSKSKKGKGYEVIIQADQIVSQKEIDSTAVGADLPKSWMDSGEAISTLQELPQYSSVSISAINFFYNVDAKEWRYGLNTSIGVASVRLR